MRSKLLLSLLVAAVGLAAPPSYSQNQEPATTSQAIQGVWTITGVAGSSQTSHLTHRQIRRLIGATLSVTANGQASIEPWKHFTTPVFSKTTYDTRSKEFWIDFKIDPATLHLPQYVTVIDFELGDLVTTASEKYLLAYEGVWFDIAQSK